MSFENVRKAAVHDFLSTALVVAVLGVAFGLSGFIFGHVKAAEARASEARATSASCAEEIPAPKS